ncbi:MAG: 30S ribosomal protein S8 [SAR202 cluster bacterium]|nr:30S ribosomal protein S8 [SAR202 cluster bacterium]|tara:strand:- start:26982 stop:27380 length:399 start_codon:yes stop_codon:yes gene_type:complete
MTMTDPISDMLTRIRNAQMVGHPDVDLPSSKVKVSIAEILKNEGFIENYTVAKQQPQDVLTLELRYALNQRPAIAGLKRVSKPGLRIHVQNKQVPRAFGGVGISIISTSQGIMTGKDAYRRGIGGELMAYVW